MVRFVVCAAFSYFFWISSVEYSESYFLHVLTLIALAISSMLGIKALISQGPTFQLVVFAAITWWFVAKADVLSESKFEFLWAPLGVMFFGILSSLQIFRLLVAKGFNGEYPSHGGGSFGGGGGGDFGGGGDGGCGGGGGGE